MKCHVCGTKIPIGATECPSCGYPIKTIHESSQKKPTHSNKKIFLSIGKVIVGMIIVLAVLTRMMPSSSSHKNMVGDDFFSQMSFQEIIEEGYDDGTVALAMQVEKRVKSLMQDELQLEDISIYEYCDEYNDGMHVKFYVEGTYQTMHYKLSYLIDWGQITTQEMVISGETNHSLRESELTPVDEFITNQIGEFLGVKDLYQAFDHSRFQMIEDRENHYEYKGGYQEYTVFMNENKSSNYNFSFSIIK